MDAPTEDEMVAATGGNYEEDREDEFLEVNGPHEIPMELRP
jgi:hypothetical protein